MITKIICVIHVGDNVECLKINKHLIIGYRNMNNIAIIEDCSWIEKYNRCFLVKN